MKKKLLFLNGHLNPGGVEKALVDVLKHLDYSKYEVDLVLFEELGAYLDQIPTAVNVRLADLHNTYGSVASSLLRCVRERDWLCFRLRVLFLMAKYFGGGVLKLARGMLFGKKQYDAAIGFRIGLCTDLVAYAVNSPQKITWWHHGEYNLSKDESEAYRETCRRMSHVIAVSEGCARFLKDYLPEISDKISVIPNMVPVKEIQEKAEMFQPYDCGTALKIVSVGRLSPEKHMENCVYAAKYLLKQGIEDFRWFIVGDGEERDRIEGLVEQHGLNGYVAFTGSQSNPYPYIKNADLFVHPSYVESQGLVVLEAMALGIPCVVTKSLGTCEFLEDEVNCVLTEKTPDSLAEMVEKMISSKGLYRHIQVNTICPNQFLPSVIMEQIESLI